MVRRASPARRPGLRARRNTRKGTQGGSLGSATWRIRTSSFNAYEVSCRARAERVSPSASWHISPKNLGPPFFLAKKIQRTSPSCSAAGRPIYGTVTHLKVLVIRASSP